ncbi:MAG: very short patch repair endonuclease [Gemmatimonadota bacterium]|nr:very short patch repair endonuclease [Gemmatimonadota bacterium]
MAKVRPTPGPASARMSRQRRRDTAPETMLRSELHRRGLRFRVHARPLPRLRREADVVFVRSRVAVFVDGCFWHGCPEHRTHPQRNAPFWREKIDANSRRDRATDEALVAAGWVAIRVWEHEPIASAADLIEAEVRRRRSCP